MPRSTSNLLIFLFIIFPSLVSAQMPQVGIYGIEWNGKEWLIGGHTLKIFEGGYSPRPLLLRYNDADFVDLSSQLQIGDTIVNKISWNGEYWLLGSLGTLKKNTTAQRSLT